MTTTSVPFHVNQRVCRVMWDDGIPCLDFAIVSRVTKSSYYVDGETKPACNWSASASDAIKEEYRYLFSQCAPVMEVFYGHNHDRKVSVEKLVIAVSKIRRMQRRLKIDID